MTDDVVAGVEGAPQAKAIVILPFAEVEQAEQFARLVSIQHPESSAVVTHGCVYNWKTSEGGEQGQVIEFFNEGGWSSFVHQDDEHIVLERRVKTEE